MVDSAALDEITESITGADGVLASTARHLLGKLGLADAGVAEAEDDLDAELVQLVESELGSDWARKVAPSFDARRAVLLDDRWASVREDFARVWVGDEAGASAASPASTTPPRRRPAGGWTAPAASSAPTWSPSTTAPSRPPTGRRSGATRWPWSPVRPPARSPAPSSPTCCAAVRRSSRPPRGWTRSGSRSSAASTATTRRPVPPCGCCRPTWPRTPTSTRSSSGSPPPWSSRPAGRRPSCARRSRRRWSSRSPLPRCRARRPTPARAPRWSSAILLWGVERLVTGLAAQGADHRIGRRVHVVLPGSPNRGRFGGDGAYGEAKAAFDAFVHALAGREGLGAAGLAGPRPHRLGPRHRPDGSQRPAGRRRHRGRRPHLVAAGDGRRAARALHAPSRAQAAAEAPIVTDLTGGLGEADLDLAALAVRRGRPPRPRPPTETDETDDTAPRPDPPGRLGHRRSRPWTGPTIKAKPEDLVVIVGAGEVGPVGSIAHPLRDGGRGPPVPGRRARARRGPPA